MKTLLKRLSLACLAPLLFLGIHAGEATPQSPHTEEKPMTVQYLEIVTPDADATVALLEKTQGLTFGDPIPEFGNARTADLAGGGRLGVRGPMRPDESPVVRPYLLVDDIAGAVAAAEAAGAQIAIPPMEMPGQGTFAIYILGGIEHGLWKK